MTIEEAVRTDLRHTALVALRDRLAVDIDACQSARDVSSLSQRLMDVLAQIEECSAAAKSQEKRSPLDELQKRRAARGAVS